MDTLLKIHGIGKELAKKLLPLLDPNKPILQQLKQKPIYDMLSTATKAHLKYKPKSAIPIHKVHNIVSLLENRGAIVAGSYRRKTETINDLDVLITDYNLIKDLFEKPYAKGSEIIRTFYEINPKYYINIDIFIYNDLAPYLLYATGSQHHNIIMRNVAKRHGLLLNQHGLFKNGKKINCKTEKDIFDTLNMKYIEPENRI